jgi:FkbM family methyltransferase
MTSFQKLKSTLLQLIKSAIPEFRRRDYLLSIASDLSSGTCAIDVGASYYPHPHWNAVRQSSNSCWVAIDPNIQNLKYLRHWHRFYRSDLVTISQGLSRHDGKQLLYVTNVDSGSSLLEPHINDDWQQRISPSYFFPLHTKYVQCLSLNTVLRDYVPGYYASPIWIKLDTQGSECQILEGLSPHIYQGNVIAIESECTLQRIPVMKGAGKLDRLTSFLEPLGFELVHLEPIQIPTSRRHKRIKGSRSILNECNAVFLLSPTYAIAKRPLSHNLSLVAAYLSYSLYQEAFQHSGRILSRYLRSLSYTESLTLRNLIKALA